MPSTSLISLTTAVLASTSLSAVIPRADSSDWQTNPAGNPFVDGWYADPDAEYYNGEYWVFPTYSHDGPEQTFLDAFSSPDLINWTKHANVLTTADFSWAKQQVWAPAPISRNGKYYLYFGANDIKTASDIGGIGVGIADSPEGPYTDPINGPLIGQYYNGAEPIDQDVFIDDDGQAYIYYGGSGHCNVGLLNEDMTSIGTFSDGTQFKEITPENYTEGAQMIKINGTYYLMWSEGNWTGPDYAVSYAMSDSPLGPFTRVDKILQEDSAIATGSGHNGILHVPDTDIYYIVYHRHPLGETDGNERVLCFDRLNFNADGTIQPVKMLVQDNFDDNNMLGWTTFGGSFSASNQVLQADQATGAKALLETAFGDLTLDVDVTPQNPSADDGDCGVIFRAGNPTDDTDGFEGYYAGVKLDGNAILYKMNGSGSTELGSAAMTVAAGTSYHIQVKVSGGNIQVFVDDMDNAKISVTDGDYTSGMDGVRVFNTAATYDNFKLQEGA